MLHERHKKLRRFYKVDAIFTIPPESYTSTMLLTVCIEYTVNASLAVFSPQFY